MVPAHTTVKTAMGETGRTGFQKQCTDGPYPAELGRFLQAGQFQLLAVLGEREDLDRPPDHDVGAIPDLAFPEDQGTGGELDCGRSLGEPSPVLGVEVLPDPRPLQVLLSIEEIHHAPRLPSPALIES